MATKPEALKARPPHGRDRIDYLDGLRGVAILSVMLWHYSDEVYASFLPYGTLFAGLPGLDRGWVGVNLFFLLSGFVILLTLERYERYTEFLRRRWLRLFPAMLIASAIVFSASQAIGDYMPHGRADLQDALPGLTFVSVGFYNEFLPFSINELDGVYWTLYVEAGFYVVFGALFYALGWPRALVAFASLWILVLVGSEFIASADRSWAAKGVQYLQWIGATYFGWFVSGALFYKANRTGSNALFAAAVVAGVVSAFTSGLWQPADGVSKAYLCACVGLFALAQKSSPVRRLLSARPLLFLGFVSYPLYLLHNELGVGVISAIGTLTPPQAYWALPFVVGAFVVALSYVVARRLEPALRRMLNGRQS